MRAAVGTQSRYCTWPIGAATAGWRLLFRTERGFYTALLSLYMFLHTVTLVYAQRGSTGLISARQQTFLYYMIQAAVALGFLTFAWSHRRCRSEPGGTVLLWSVMGAYVLGMTALFLRPVAAVFLFVGPAAVFWLGYLGGAVYSRMAAALAGSPYLGRVMGLGCALSYGGQYLFQHLWGDTPLFPMSLLGAFLLTARMIGGRPLGQLPAAEADLGERGEEPRRGLLWSCVVMACLCALLSFLDGTLTQLASASGFQTYDPYSWPRLLMIPAYLLFGALGDVEKGRYVPLATFCAVLASLLHPVLPNYTLNMCLFYIGVGAVFSYAYLTFWRLAPRTRWPELWASMGRILDGAVTVVLGAAGFSTLQRPAVVAVDALLIAVLVVAMAVNGDLALTYREEAGAEPSPAPPVDKTMLLAGLAREYALSPREADVFRELVLTDHTQREIAEALGIRLSTLQHHTTSIYRKTGADNRAGLHRLYREAATGEN